MTPTASIRTLLVSVVLMIPNLLACGRTELAPSVPASSPVPVKLTSAHEENLATLYRSSGTVRGQTTAVLTSKTTGYVRAVDVRPGDTVRAGQLLTVLEANDSTAGVRRARAGFDQSLEARTEAENQLRSAQATLRVAQATHQRISAMYASQSIPQQAYDESEARLQAALAEEQAAQARLRSSSARIAQAKAEVGEAQASLDDTRITAPFAGQVIERRIDPGNLALPGTPLLVLEQEGTLRVETAVEESHAASVALGDGVVVEIEALPQPVNGKVAEIVPAVDAASRAFLVKIDLAGERAGLRPGMFARVGFRVNTRPRLVVPTSAITKNGALDRVFATDGEWLRLRMVTLGEAQGPWTEVLSGLTSGDRLVATPTPLVTDGARFTEQP